jgi:hypothetical protein
MIEIPLVCKSVSSYLSETVPGVHFVCQVTHKFPGERRIIIISDKRREQHQLSV